MSDPPDVTPIPRPRRWSYWLRVLLCNAALLFLGVLVIELVFGQWWNDDRMSRLNLPVGVELEFSVGDLYPTGRETISYRRDQHGLRGSYESLSSIDILTIGGSTTDQRYLDDNDTWQQVMRDRFRDQGRGVSVVNAGVDGQSTFGHIKDFDWWFPELPDLQARYFLCYVGINDLYKDPDYSFDSLQRGSPVTLAGRIQENSAMYHLARTVRGIYQAHAAARVGHRKISVQSVSWTTRPLLKDHDAHMEERLKLYQARLRVLIGRIRDHGGVPILVTQASRRTRATANGIVGTTEVTRYGELDINGVDHGIMMRALNDTTLATAKELGVIAFDLAADVTLDDEDYYDYSHHTPTGARKIGEYLHEKLEPLL